MAISGESNGDTIDGARVVYLSEHKGGYEYSLVEVPLGLPIAIRYEKRATELNVRLMPVTPSATHCWWVDGSVDADTIQNLGLPVASPRTGPAATLLEEEQANQIRAWGSVDRKSETLWDVDLELAVNYVYGFLRSVWRPTSAPAHRTDVVPIFHLGDAARRIRLLPQKRFVLTRSPKDRSTLIVFRSDPGPSDDVPVTPAAEDDITP